MIYDIFLFDLDDTLFDFGETEKSAFSHSFQSSGFPNGLRDYRASYNTISKVLWDDLEQGRISLAELKTERFKRLFMQHGLDMNAEVFGQTYLENLGKEVHLIEGVTEMLTSLAGCKLAILTNGFKDVQLARIDGSVLKNSFEAIITSEEAGYQKPQAEIFEYTFNKLGIADKSRVLMIGDSLSSDIQGGNNFGIDTCWFNPQQKINSTTARPTYEIQYWNEFNFGHQVTY
ncbi:YjjG family noncanonical pyrimidine nucleotidase [Sporosarcina sp. E16_8]|uniref:YjjG family noncanonical pyrimidine nucleotidase n=1 Tax=Sporosarcina sp. E16_8 TaxID=2789295 RepID=UPI001A937EB0|nr:noncanonical pyrimidine nucleotidase, YjjG family [Sporosarcina sp. E16_8]